MTFFKINFFQINSFRNTIRVSNCLDPDQDRHSVGHDLSPDCFQRLSADDKSPLARRELKPQSQLQRMTNFMVFHDFGKK